MQSPGCGQTAHYAAIRSYADGSPTIDRYAGETCDLVQRNGHYYAAKQPALDFWTAPWYLLLRSTGAVPPNPNAGQAYPAAMVTVPLRALWQMGVWAVVLPAVLLLVLLRRTVERLEPGLGTAARGDPRARDADAAVLDACCSRMCPLRCSRSCHSRCSSDATPGRGGSPLRARRPGSPSRRTRRSPRRRCCSASTRRRAPRTSGGWSRSPQAASSGSCPLLGLRLVGVRHAVPPRRTPALRSTRMPAGSSRRRTTTASSGSTLPNLHVAANLLLSQRGLLVLTPVVGAGLAGIVLLWRRGLRSEAALIAALCIVQVLWNSGRGGIDVRWRLGAGAAIPDPAAAVPLLRARAGAAAHGRRPSACSRSCPRARCSSRRARSRCSRTTTRTTGSRGSATATSRRRSSASAASGTAGSAILPFYGFAAIAAAAAIAATPTSARPT